MAEDTLDMLTNRLAKLQGAVAAIKELSADPNVRHQALVEEMARRDWISWTDEAETRGLERGIEIGHIQGLEQGEYNKARAIARNLIKSDLPLETIIMATGLTRIEIESLRN